MPRNSVHKVNSSHGALWLGIGSARGSWDNLGTVVIHASLLPWVSWHGIGCCRGCRHKPGKLSVF